MRLRITMQEPGPGIGEYVRFHVRRSEDGLVYGDWTPVDRADEAGLRASDEKPVVEAWEDVKDYAAARSLAWIYVEDPQCIFDAERLGLARDPDNDCSNV